LFIALAYLGIGLANWIAGRTFYGDQRIDWAYTAFHLLGMAGPAAVLWSRRPLSLAWLRAIELWVFGSVMVLYALFAALPIFNGALLRYDPLGEAGGWAVGGALTLPAFSAIVLYGLFIPNTWRRCAAVVTAMALVPFIVVAGSIHLSGAA